MTSDTHTTFKHAEAFCLLTYRAYDGREEEIIYNARDGAVPTHIMLRSGRQARHVDIEFDTRIRDYEPPTGTRKFVNLGLDTARAIAREKTQLFPSICPKNPDDLPSYIESLAQSFVGKGDTPHLVEVQ